MSNLYSHLHLPGLSQVSSNGQRIAVKSSAKTRDLSSHYIWRTRGDGKVRSSHAQNNGKIFSWDNPPPTGHPGTEYGCRCTAEPFIAEVREQVTIKLAGISDAGRAWSDLDFVNHYFSGNGHGVLMRETGHLRRIVEAYSSIVLRGRRRLPSQIAESARQIKNGAFQYSFENTYDLTSTVFSIGNTTVAGNLAGYVEERGGVLTLEGRIDFFLRDEFAKPLDINTEVINPARTFNENISYPIEDRIWQILNRTLPDPIKRRRPNRFGVHNGIPYSITDHWTGSLSGTVYASRAKSRYKWT